MKRNRVYTNYNDMALNGAGSSAVLQFEINNNNRESLLKSIFFDIQIRDPLAGTMLPLEQNTTQYFQLAVSALPGSTPFSQAFELIAPVPGSNVTGSQINFFRPTMLKVESFYIANVLRFQLAITNNDPLISYRYSSTIIVEIEDFPLRYAL